MTKEHRRRAITAAARQVLARSPETMKTLSTPLGSAMFLRDGQPHIRVGIPILARHLSTLVLAITQAVLIAIVAHDFWRLIEERSDLLLLLPALGQTPMQLAAKYHMGLLLGLVSAMPVFFLVNVGWVLFAEKLLYPDRPFWQLHSLRHGRTLLAGLMGFVPLRLVAVLGRRLIVPEWLRVASSEPRAAVVGLARLGQFYTAARIAMRNCDVTDSHDAEIALANAIDKRGEDILDGLGSYVFVPIVVYAVMAAALVIVSYFQIVANPAGLFSPGMAMTWAAFLAFTKAGLGALVIDSMR